MTKTQRAAMQQALGALEYYRSGEDYQPTPANTAIEALRAALAEPEPEPVRLECREHGQSEWVDCSREAFGINPRRYVYRALYTATPARQPLTDDEIVDAVQDADLDWHAGWSLDDDALNRYVTLIRAVERAHGIGGNDEQH